MPFDNTPPALDVNDLIAWLEAQKPWTPYPGKSGVRCLLCQWLSARTGKPVVYGWSGSVGLYVVAEYGARQTFDMSALEHAVAQASPWTFGHALERARKVAASG